MKKTTHTHTHRHTHILFVLSFEKDTTDGIHCIQLRRRVSPCSTVPRHAYCGRTLTGDVETPHFPGAGAYPRDLERKSWSLGKISQDAGRTPYCKPLSRAAGVPHSGNRRPPDKKAEIQFYLTVRQAQSDGLKVRRALVPTWYQGRLPNTGQAFEN
jgi:hypothetical protein